MVATYADALTEQGKLETTRNENTTKSYKLKNGQETFRYKSDAGSVQVQGKDGQTDSIEITEKVNDDPENIQPPNKLDKLKRMAGLLKKEPFVAPERNLSNLDWTPFARHTDAMYGTNLAQGMKDPYQAQLKNAIEQYKMQEDPLQRAGLAAQLQGQMSRNEDAELARNIAKKKDQEWDRNTETRSELYGLPLRREKQENQMDRLNYGLKEKKFSETKKNNKLMYDLALAKRADLKGKNAAEKKANIAKDYNKNAQDISAGKYLNPGVKKLVDTYYTKIAGAQQVKTNLKTMLEQYRAAKTEDQKVQKGRGMLKLLNSLLGADAIAEHEQVMHGALLEFRLGNLFEPGKFVGRDLKGFDQQVSTTIQAIEQGNIDAKAFINNEILNNSMAPMNPDGTMAVPAATNDPGQSDFLTPEQEAELRHLEKLELDFGGGN